MILQVKHKKYYTNITDKDLIDKCVNFFLDGCTSYAISFENDPKYIITKQKTKSIDCYLLKGFNNELKFVPEHAEKDNDFNKILKKGLDSIEIV